MNTKHNARYKDVSKKIENAFLILIEKYRYENITVGQICQQAGINRSTFYCHYQDINDFVIKIEQKFANSLAKIFQNGERRTHEAFIEMFNFIKKNKLFYQAFLNIPYATMAETNTKIEILKNVGNNQTNLPYNIGLFYRASFFGAGIKEMCRLWLKRDCQESPAQMASLLLDEYKNREL